MKTLILYYSYSGNTKSIANKIKTRKGYDIEEITTTVPYSDDYDAVVSQGKEEIDNGYEPEINNINIDKYDTIILGTPVWWYTYAPAIKTFLSNHDLTDKTIIPFVTNGGWPGHTIEDIKEKCPNVKNPINIKFNQDILVTSENEINSWIEGLD